MGNTLVGDDNRFRGFKAESQKPHFEPEISGNS